MFETYTGIKRILDEGTNAAREKASAKMTEIKKAMKIDYDE